MNFESVVSDVKTRVEDVSNRAQSVAELSIETVRKANGIVVPTFQSIVERQGDAVRELVENGRSTVTRVREDGLKAVAMNPIEYLPFGRDVVIDAFSMTIDLTAKAGNELAEVLRKAFEDALARINGEVAAPAPTPKKRAAAPRKRAAAKKTVAKKATAKKAAKKTAKKA